MRRLFNPLSLLIALVLLLFTGAQLCANYWWYDAVGHRTLFLTAVTTHLLIFLLSAGFVLGVLLINLALAQRRRRTQVFPLLIAFSTIAASIVGLATSAYWFSLLAYRHATAFGLTDPVFGHDLSFYVFTLPALLIIWRFLFATTVLTLLIVGAHYLISALQARRQPIIEIDGIPQSPDARAVWRRLKGKQHLSLIASVLFLLLSVWHLLARYTLLFSQRGIVVGAGYTDTHVLLPAQLLLALLALIVAGTILWRPRYTRAVLTVYALGIVLGLLIIPGLVQQLVVAPNELNLEHQFLERSIAATRHAYGLDAVTTRDFIPAPLTREKVRGVRPRLLDPRPLEQTYKQTQEIRPYYDLSGIDTDRYTLNGTLTHVMLAPRELNQQRITPTARTWVNLHEVFTHGYGAVMSPVDIVTPEGLPTFLIKDIPPQTSDPALAITEPRIYYGEQTLDYVLVNSPTAEFDYPRGDTNAYTRYTGAGGVALTSFWRRLVMALNFKDLKVLLSSTPDTKVQFRRAIVERVRTLAPFLELDSDPYLVIANGRLVWIIDAYTHTRMYPYSTPLAGRNYLRDAVKVVIDAYDGTVTFYLAEHEPLIDTYSAMFPGTFQPIDAMPASLRAHLRHPRDLFKTQALIYRTFHMSDPRVFYNKEDSWGLPMEIYGTGQRVPMEPYYLLLNERFILMTPFTPANKDNMIAWFAADSDGTLTLYQFPKDELIYGPSQVEATIDQDSEISQQLTLWSQQGSKVTRGNLLVIPVEDSILYVEPLYLQAETGQLPQLKRVIVSDGERVAMAPTLAAAFDKLFGAVSTATVTVAEARAEYAALADALREGDWAGFGTHLARLGSVLEQLE